MQWPWCQHGTGSGSQPIKTEIGSGTGKCTACVVYTCKMYILYTMREYANTQRKKKARTRDTSDFRITVFGLLKNYMPCPNCHPPTSPQLGHQCPMMVWYSSQVLARWKCAIREDCEHPFENKKVLWTSRTSDNLKGNKYTSMFVKWDWKQRLKHRIQSHLEKNVFQPYPFRHQ